MITAQEAIRALEKVRDRADSTEAERAFAAGLEAIIWQLLNEEKKLDEVTSVLFGINKTVERLKTELIVDHNKDIEAISATLSAMDDLINSMRRPL